MALNITPLGDRVVVKRLKAETTTKGGIVLPDSAQEKPRQGKVLAVGSEVTELKKGNRVLMASYGGTEVTVDEQELVILKEEDVLAVVED